MILLCAKLKILGRDLYSSPVSSMQKPKSSSHSFKKLSCWVNSFSSVAPHDDFSLWNSLSSILQCCVQFQIHIQQKFSYSLSCTLKIQFLGLKVFQKFEDQLWTISGHHPTLIWRYLESFWKNFLLLFRVVTCIS